MISNLAANEKLSVSGSYFCYCPNVPGSKVGNNENLELAILVCTGYCCKLHHASSWAIFNDGADPKKAYAIKGAIC